MKLRLLLADAAEVREGLLFLLGGGWTEAGPPPHPFAIAGLFEVPWEETNQRQRFEITIEDEDGHPLNVATPSGEQPFKIEGGLDVGRPPFAIPGRSFNLPIALMIPPIPWKPGSRYIVRARIDGAVMDETTFVVRSVPPA